MKRKKYKNTREGRIAEAKDAITRLQLTLSQGDNRFGEYGRNCRDAIARWQQVIDKES